MPKINFLFVTKDWRNGIEKNTVYLAECLKKLTNFMEWSAPGDINDIIKKLPYKPDFILLNDLRPTRCPEITGLDRLKIPFGIIMHDLNYDPAKRKAFIKDNNIRHLFVHYRDRFYKDYYEFKDRMIWFPHWVNTKVFKDYHLPKEYSYLMMGCMWKGTYPLRAKMLETMKDLPGFKYHQHPGYEQKDYKESEFIVGARYAKEINKAKLFLTDNSIYQYTFMKYFEAAACNTLLVAPNSQEVMDLGFVPSVHFIEVDENSFLDKAKYYAKNYEKFGQMIALNGFEMVREKHSVEIRAKQLMKKILDIIG